MSIYPSDYIVTSTDRRPVYLSDFTRDPSEPPDWFRSPRLPEEPRKSELVMRHGITQGKLFLLPVSEEKNAGKDESD